MQVQVLPWHSGHGHRDAVVHYLAFSDPSSSFSDTPIPSLLLWGGTPLLQPGKDEVNVFTWPAGWGWLHFFSVMLASYKLLSSTSFLLASMPPFLSFAKDCRVFLEAFVESVPVGISRLLPILALSPQMYEAKQNKNKTKQTSRDTHFYVVTQVPGRSAIFSTPFVSPLILFSYIISSMFS